jgi:hypothetical protein
MFLHLNLKRVLSNFVALHVGQTRILNQHTCSQVVLNNVLLKYRIGVASSQEPTSLISLDHVVTNDAFGVNHHDSVIVPRNLVVLN